MAAQVKEGDQVSIIDREPTPNDEKSQMYFNHYRNATGVLEKVYEDGKACVVVDVESLPSVIQERHKDLTLEAKQKWLDGLSNEARNRLTPDEQVFNMRYTILVNMEDVVKQGSKPSKPKAESAKTEKDAKSVTQSDLEKAEEEFLKSRQSNA